MKLFRILSKTAGMIIISVFLITRPLWAETVTYVVPTDFPGIQEAIDEAARQLVNNPANKYSILVEPGIYIIGSSILLKSHIPIRGRETARTILIGGTTDPLIIGAGVSNVSVSNLTFLNALSGIAVGENSSTITISNNVFAVGLDGLGVLVGKTTDADIVNNTFYQNRFAVARDSEGISIKNNIFANNTGNITNTADAELTILYNAFHPKWSETEPKGTQFIPPQGVDQETDPLFSDITGTIPDFHLQAGSHCINGGDPSLPDPYTAPTETAISDIGAYGGPNADTIPFPVSGLKEDSSSTTSAALSWSANKAYNIKGYKVYFGRSAGVFDGTDTVVVSGATHTSPIDVGNALTATIDNLSTTVTTTPDAPVLNSLVPASGGLVASWSAVPGATSYSVHYGIASTSENIVRDVTTTSYTLTGLVNGQIYQVAISAVKQSAYYFAITAYDDSGQPVTRGQAHESAIAEQAAKITGDPVESVLSNVVSDFPEELVANPKLSDSRIGCFIATAAFGWYSAPEVQALRMFRDRFLVTNRIGAAFVEWYYNHSPAAAAWLNDHPGLKPVVRAALWPMVGAALFMTKTSLLFKAAVLSLMGTIIFLGFRKRAISRR